MSLEAYFSPDYATARRRFRAAVATHGVGCEALPIEAPGPNGEALTIDVAQLGPADAPGVVVVSSGLHGVEGFLGSAIQLALLEERLGAWELPADTRLVIAHALNPYGFAWLRRVNEHNVDLNRNFLLQSERFEGAPEGYAELDSLLNPPRPPRALVSAFLPKAALTVARHGFEALKDAVAGGQYDFPQGLFFGGHRPEPTQTLLHEHLPGWIGAAERVVHIDFHSGLGARATYKLLVDLLPTDPRFTDLRAEFGHEAVEGWEPDGVAYQVRGGLGPWCEERIGPGCRYDTLVAEFGTYPALRVIEALHHENRAAHHADPTSAATRKAKERLRQVFAPAEADWRRSVVTQGLRICDQALAALAPRPQPTS